MYTKHTGTSNSINSLQLRSYVCQPQGQGCRGDSLVDRTANAIDLFRFLKYGLSIVLVFIGVKMLIVKWVHIPTTIALGVVAAIILSSIVLSVIFRPRKANADLR